MKMNSKPMKNITFLTLFLISLSTFAQDSPGKRPALLMDKSVKIKPIPKTVLAYQQGYDSFYTDENLLKKYAENKSHKTNHDALANRVLKVTAVEPLPAQGAKNYKIKLQDTLSNETIFFKFNELSENKGMYYFEVIGGLTYPPDFFCDYLQEKTDPATGEQKIMATLTEGITVSKTTRGKSPNYIMEVRTVEPIISMMRGVSFVMENGLQVVKPEVECQMVVSSNDNLVYTASFELTPHEVSLLTQSRIVSGKISKFEKKYNDGEKLRQMLKCMSKK